MKAGHWLDASAEAFRSDWRQHLDDKRFWTLMIIAPLAAIAISPPPGAGYGVLTLGGHRLSPDFGTIGLELGAVAATVMTPFAFIWLRSGATRRRPEPLTATAGVPRIALVLGRFLADSGILFLSLVSLSFAGGLIAFQRTSGDIGPLLLLGALWGPALPVLLVVAGLRALLDALPLLRGWAGDALFVLLWLTSLSWSVAVATGNCDVSAAAPLRDPFGFLSPLIAGSTALEDPCRSLTLAVVATEGWTPVAVSEGLSVPGYWPSRFGTAAAGTALALAAGLVNPVTRHKGSFSRRGGERGGSGRRPAVRGRGVFGVTLAGLVRDRSEGLLLFAAAMLCAFLPYGPWGRGIIAIFLVLPLSAAATRYGGKGLRPLLSTVPTAAGRRLAATAGAGLCLAAALHLPTLISGRLSLADAVDALPVLVGFPVAAPLLGSMGASRTVVCVPFFVAAYALLTAA